AVGEDVLHLHREGRPGAATPRPRVPFEVHPRGRPRRVGVGRLGRTVTTPGSGGQGVASGGERVRAAPGTAGPWGEPWAGAIGRGPADRAADRGLPERGRRVG